MLGLKHGRNLLVAYDPEWPAAFDQERTRIRSAVGDVARGIEHYGSTAVVGLRAKPIIDILIGVAPLQDWMKCKAPLESLGYDYAENAGVPGHYIFGRGRDRSERTHLVHVVEFDGESWRSNLAFRDALISDELLRADYLRVKEHAVAVAPEGRAKYNELKHTFIERFKGRMAMLTLSPVPAEEAAPFYKDFLAAFPDGRVGIHLTAQVIELEELCAGLTESGAMFRYDEGKWTIKEVIGHLLDTERVYAYRLLRISRGDATELPGCDDMSYATEGQFNRRSVAELVSEFTVQRASTLALVNGIPPAVWPRVGRANGFRTSARALVYIILGHTAHHCRVLRERYRLPVTR